MCCGAATVFEKHADARHLETVNVAFGDGHVKAMRMEKFYYQNMPWLEPD